jgi:hypothetical protein
MTNLYWKKLAEFAALSAWIGISAAMVLVAYVQFGQDFRGYYAAARVLLQGGNPYDYTQVAPILLETTGKIGNNPFYYPLWFGWLIVPLALMPYPLARAAWLMLNLVIWLLSLLRLQSFLDFPPRGWQTWLLNLLATFLFAWMTWKFEQLGILLFALALEILIAFKNRQWNRMGFFLAAALIKPNIMLVPVGVVCLWLLRRRIFRPLVVMCALLGGAIAVTSLLTPAWYHPFLQPGFARGLTVLLDGTDKVVAIRVNTTLMDWLKMFHVPSAVRNLLYAAAVAGAVWACAASIWRSHSLTETMVIALLANFAVTPYALQYDFPPLTIVLFWGLALAKRSGSLKIPALLSGMLVSVLFWEKPISDGYWIVLLLCLLAAWAIQKTDRAITP